MDCEEVDRFIDVYLDGELDLGRRLALEQHLTRCPVCRSLVDERREFRSFLAASVPRQNTSPDLEAKVLAAVRRRQAEQKLSFLRQPWIYTVAVVVLSAFLGLKILFPDAERELSRQAVLRHFRSLSTLHMVDVASSNPAVVRPWLTARLDFAPPVVGSPASGYSLLGGRVDVIQNRSVAALVYKNEKDVVTLFCWPPKKEHLSNSDYFIEGYHAYTWSNAQCNYIFVSTLSDRARAEFEDSFRVRVQSGAYF
jgi:anti-sigma factor RsiW